MAHQNASISSIGSLAQEILASPGAAAVIGVTSRGAFVRLAGVWAAFLSFEGWRGPLTLNLAGGTEALRGLENGAPVEHQAGRLVFPTLRLEISTENVTIWEAPPLPGEPLQMDIRRERIKALAWGIEEGVYREGSGKAQDSSREKSERSRPESGFTPLLIGRESQPATLKSYTQLGRALKAGRAKEVASALDRFIGLGSGLTPSGDDLIAGFLLALRRWGKPLGRRVGAREIMALLAETAARGTTTLSTSLMRAAALGQADERLIAALDGLAYGQPELEACYEALAGWGSSSGFDALAGMGLILA